MLRHLLAITFLLPFNVHALDIIEVLQLAEQHDAIFDAARASYLAEVENENISGGALLPQITFNAFTSETSSSTSNSSSTSSPNGDSDFGAHGYSFVLSQTLYDRTLFDTADADTARTAQALAELEAARQQLYIRVAESYFALASAQDALALARAEQNAIAKQLEQNTERFKAGIIASTDVKESQAQYDLSVADTIVAENTLNNRQEALRLLIDRPITQTGSLVKQFPLALPEPDDIDNWQQQALDNNPELHASRHALHAAQQQHSSAIGEHYPTLSLDAEHSFNSSDGSTISNAFSGRDIDQNKISLNLELPIYAGGSTSAAARKKLAERNTAKAEYEQQRRITIQQIRSAFLNIKASISRVNALKQALISTQLATEATQAGFDAGKRTSVDVLVAQREQFASENAYTTARYDYLLNLLRLKQASGLLAVSDLQHINQYITHAE